MQTGKFWVCLAASYCCKGPMGHVAVRLKLRPRLAILVSWSLILVWSHLWPCLMSRLLVRPFRPWSGWLVLRFTVWLKSTLRWPLHLKTHVWGSSHLAWWSLGSYSSQGQHILLRRLKPLLRHSICTVGISLWLLW